MIQKIAFAISIVLLALNSTYAQDSDTVVMLTHDSFAVSEELLDAFEETYGVRVEILRGGDAGQMVNQAVLSKNNPLADVLYGIDNTFLSRALNAEIFLAYESPELERVATEFIS